MKKLLVIGMMVTVLGSTAFANRHEEHHRNLPKHINRMQKVGHHGKRDIENEKLRIEIDEKRLEIRKELLNDKPNWDKIEKLNIEIATQEAKVRTCRMRENYEKESSNNR